MYLQKYLSLPSLVVEGDPIMHSWPSKRQGMKAPLELCAHTALGSQAPDKLPEYPPVLPALAETAPVRQILGFHANRLSLKEKLKTARNTKTVSSK